MLPKESEKMRAMHLRLLGHSLNEIAERLHISKSSASIWLRDVPLEASARKTLAKKSRAAREKSAETRRAQTTARLQESALLAEKTLAAVDLDQKLSQLLCALIYWCEGEKTRNDRTLAFTNSDPSLVRTFLHLFRKGFSVEEHKFRVCLHLHDYHNERKQIRFWSHTTGIPANQFLKTYKKSHTGKRAREGYAGCASIRYYDTRIARQLQAVARAFLKQTGL